MKKSVVVLFFAFSSGLAMAAKPNYYYKTSEELFSLTPEVAFAISNLVSESASVISVKNFLLDNRTKLITQSFISENEIDTGSVDAVLGPIGCCFENKNMPLCYTNFIDCRFPTDMFKKTNLLMKRAGISRIWNSFWIRVDGYDAVKHRLGVFEEILFWNGGFGIKEFRTLQNTLKNDYAKAVKYMLHNQGKSFVVKEDGENPLEPYMGNFVKAINSPRFNGIEECLAEVGISDFDFGRDDFINDDKIETMKSNILLGEIEFDSHMSFLLLFSLGVDGYNEFVRQYNGK